MLPSLCTRALGHLLIRSRAIKTVSSLHTPRVLRLDSRVCVRTPARCAYLSSSVSHTGSSARAQQPPSVEQQPPSVEQVLHRFSRFKDWHCRPIDSLLSALGDTDVADRAKNCLSILNVYRSVAAGRAVTAQHLQQIWRLVTEGDETQPPRSDAVLQCLRLYTDCALLPPPALSALAVEPELTSQLVHCLCAAGRPTEAAPLLDRLRAAGAPPPQHALHALIVAHAGSGGLDTARDMAQALLPAGAGDDSDHQLMMMRMYIAARRPAPLAALLTRWYQQRGQLTIAESVTLLEALATSDQLDQLQQVVPLVPWSRYGHSGAGCVRLQRLLVRLGQPRVALHLINTAVNHGAPDRELVRLARGLITEMAVTEQPIASVAEVCAALSGGPLLPNAWFAATEVLYRLGRWRPALQLLLRAHRAGLPLREHLFWPGLLQQANAGDVEGVRCTLSEMVSAGAPPGLETLRDYALPVYLWPGAGRPPAELVVQHLKEAGVTVAAAADALIGRLLASKHWHEAASVCERYAASVSVPVLVSAVLYALQQAAGGAGPGSAVPVDACVRLLRCAFEERAAHEDPVGAVLMEMTAAAGRPGGQSAELLRLLLQAAGPAGLRLSPAAAELVCERLLLAPALAELQPPLLALADAAVSSRPWDSLEAGSAQDGSVEELEDHLVELTKKDGNTRGILRKLILIHCRKHNLERALSLEEELSQLSVSDQGGEPLSPGLLSALLALHVYHGRLEQALSYKRRLERRHDAGHFLDQFKRVDLAALLVRRGHTDDALSLLEQLQPESESSRLSINCWRLLAAAADWGDTALTARLLELLQRRQVVTPSGHHWAQLVRAHIVSGDLAGAVAEFRRCAQDQRVAAYSHGLLLEAARLQHAERRHQLLDQIVRQLMELHGAESAQYDLALALSEAGHVVQARRIMTTLGGGAHFTDGRLKRHCNRLSKAGEVATLVRLLQSLPHKQARLAVYWPLLNAYERTADLASVEDVITQLEDGEMMTGKLVNHARRLAERLRERSERAPATVF